MFFFRSEVSSSKTESAIAEAKTNIKENQFLSSKIPCPVKVRVMERCGNLVTFLDEASKLYLLDIEKTTMLWSRVIDLSESLDDTTKTTLKITADGIVFCITPTKGDAEKFYNIQIFYKGEQTGIIKGNWGYYNKTKRYVVSGFEPDSLYVSGDRIFGVENNEDSAVLFEWDIKGNIVRQESIPKWEGTSGALTLCNELYYSCAVKHTGISKDIPPFFMLNVKTNTSQLFMPHVFRSEDKKLYCSSIFLHGDNLLCGMYHEERTYDDTLPIPRFRIFNINTGELKKEYILGSGFGMYGEKAGTYTAIHANNEYIIFLLQDYPPFQDTIFAIDLIEDQIKSIKTVSAGRFQVSIALEGNVLVMGWVEKANIFNQSIIDLKTSEALYEAAYPVEANYFPSYEDGKLLMLCSDENGEVNFNIQDYNKEVLEAKLTSMAIV